MDQRLICLFLVIERPSAQAIHNELVTVLHPDAIVCYLVTGYLHQRRFLSVPCDPSEKPANSVADDASLHSLEKQPFFSIRELAKFTCI
jgi:hypothetical protein